MKLNKKATVLILLIALSNICCSSYILTSIDELKSDPSGNIRVEKKDRSVTADRLLEINTKDSLLTAQSDTLEEKVPFAEIENIYQERFDVPANVILVPLTFIGVGAVITFCYFILSGGSNIGE